VIKSYNVEVICFKIVKNSLKIVKTYFKTKPGAAILKQFSTKLKQKASILKLKTTIFKWITSNLLQKAPKMFKITLKIKLRTANLK
jgi:hypothetical protein